MTPEEKERYVRWQDHRVNQLSFSINLFLGFAVASLAFAINLIINDYKNEPTLEFVISIWGISALAGCLATITRLLDFRYTASKIKSSNKCNEILAKHLGKITWSMFWVQVLTYPFGAVCFVLDFVFVLST